MIDYENMERLNARYDRLLDLERIWSNDDPETVKGKPDNKRKDGNKSVLGQHPLIDLEDTSLDYLLSLPSKQTIGNSVESIAIPDSDSEIVDAKLAQTDSRNNTADTFTTDILKGKRSDPVNSPEICMQKTGYASLDCKSNAVDVSNHKKRQKQSTNPDISDIVRYFKASGVVGEEKNAVLMYLALGNNLSFGVEGPSGSGKTFLADKLMNLIPENDLYKVDLSSKMALFYDAAHINGHGIIYFPELQKAMSDKRSPIIEIIKNLTEGKDVKRIVTNSNRNGNQSYNITSGKTVIYTLAFENEFKKDAETSRRFIRFRTDNSKEHFTDIHSYKAMQRMSLDLLTENIDTLRSRLSERLSDVRGLKDTVVIDPFAQYVSRFIPQTQKSIGYVDHYYNLVDACAKFNHHDRVIVSANGKDAIIANLEDHFTIYNLYYDEFVKSLDELDRNVGYDKERVAAGKAPDISIRPDWQVCFKQGMDELRNVLMPNESTKNSKIYEYWFDAQVIDGKIMAVDYMNGKNREITMVYKGLPVHEGAGKDTP